MPLISVLMPAYNAGNYIKDAIDSILGQTFTNFEFIIINDGSKDDTAEIIRSYSDPRIRFIDCQQNQGLINVLNMGIKEAKAELIARMDADDVCTPDRLQVQYDFMKQHPDYVMVGAASTVTDKEGNYLMDLDPIGFSDEEIRERILEKCPFIHPAVTFKKSVVIAAGCYPDNALTFEDHMLWKHLLNFGKVCNLPQRLIHVRFNPESITVDERWRGPEFIAIRKRSLENGAVSKTDGETLRAILKAQNFSAFKQASYYAMVAKKYLWNTNNSTAARQYLKEAIKLFPSNKLNYILYALSFFPFSVRKSVYRSMKNKMQHS